jgi:predicted RecA/RadA family phage recombinase
MANLTSDRNTETKLGDSVFSFPVAAATKLYAGGIAGLDAAGYLVPATGAGIKIPALVEETVDNSGGSAGAAYARVRRGVVGLDPGTGVNQAAVGTMVYFSDDHTVTATADGNSPAGILLELSEGQAWVDLKTAAPGSYPEPVAGE